MTAPSKLQAAKLAVINNATLYRWFNDQVFMEAYRAARRHMFDDMLATIEKAGNLAALALVRELHRAEEAGGGFVLIHCARTIIDRAIKSQSFIAVQEEMEKLRRVAAACPAGLTAPAVPKALDKTGAEDEPRPGPDRRVSFTHVLDDRAGQHPRGCRRLAAQQPTAVGH